MTRLKVIALLSFVALAFSAAFAGALAFNPPSIPDPNPSNGACIWKWIGPGTGWVKQSDECGGFCLPPNFNGTVLGEQQVTFCFLDND